jgi:putative nucleotidyltransferase with HDIG domain
MSRPEFAEPQPLAPGPEGPRVESADEAVQFFAALLLAALRNALIYSPDHAHFHQALGKAERMAEIAFGFRPDIVFVCIEQELFFAGKPMNRRGAQFQRLAEFMHSLGIQRLEVRRGLTAEELKAFALNLIGLSEAGDGTGRKRVLASPHIRIGRMVCPEAAGASSLARGSDGGEGGEAAESTPQAGLSQAARLAASEELAACTAVAHLVAGLARHAGHLTLLAALHRHHPPSYVHSVTVALLAAAQARAMQAGPELVRDLLLAGLLHDLGKLAVPAPLLDKGGRRSAAEERTYQQHCVVGASLLTRYPAVPRAAVVAAFEHHLPPEGGGGFPRTRRTPAPHPVSQIVALANAYDHARGDAGGQGRPTVETFLGRVRGGTPHRIDDGLLRHFPQAVAACEPPADPDPAVGPSVSLAGP